jgi:hypothetical protein
MGHLIIFAIFGICGLLLPKETKQRMMNEEANEWYEEGEM